MFLWGSFSWIFGGVFALLALVVSEAQAIDSVRARQIRGGEIVLIVRGAEPFGVMTWEGVEIGTPRRNRTFRARTFAPSNCIGDLSDGVMTLDVEVDRGTPTQALVERTGSTIDDAVGEDGDIQAGVKFPEPRFTVNNPDGTVTENLTGLIWLQDWDCLGSQTWANALAAVNALAGGDVDCNLSDGSQAGDWRLPNVKEPQSLVDYGEFNPALPDVHPFNNFQLSGYWSSTTNTNDPDFAWLVNFIDGRVLINIKSNLFLVLPVRGGS